MRMGRALGGCCRSPGGRPTHPPSSTIPSPSVPSPRPVFLNTGCPLWRSLALPVRAAGHRLPHEPPASVEAACCGPTGRSGASARRRIACVVRVRFHLERGRKKRLATGRSRYRGDFRLENFAGKILSTKPPPNFSTWFQKKHQNFPPPNFCIPTFFPAQIPLFSPCGCLLWAAHTPRRRGGQSTCEINALANSIQQPLLAYCNHNLLAPSNNPNLIIPLGENKTSTET